MIDLISTLARMRFEFSAAHVPHPTVIILPTPEAGQKFIEHLLQCKAIESGHHRLPLVLLNCN